MEIPNAVSAQKISQPVEGVTSARRYRNSFIFREHFEGDLEILIPRVYPSYSTQRVLTTDYVEGQRLGEFLVSSSEEERNRAGRALFKFQTLSVFVNSMMHADQHAGNFLFASGKLAILDFGRVVKLDPALMTQYRRVLVATIRGDKEGVRALMECIDFVRDWDSFDFDEFWELQLLTQRHYALGESFRFSRDYIAQFQRAVRNYPEKDNLRMTPYALWNLCSCHGAWSLLADLGAQDDWGKLTLRLFDERGGGK